MENAYRNGNCKHCRFSMVEVVGLSVEMSQSEGKKRNSKRLRKRRKSVSRTFAVEITTWRKRCSLSPSYYDFIRIGYLKMQQYMWIFCILPQLSAVVQFCCLWLGLFPLPIISGHLIMHTPTREFHITVIFSDVCGLCKKPQSARLIRCHQRWHQIIDAYSAYKNYLRTKRKPVFPANTKTD